MAQLVPDEREAPIVRRIFDLYTAGRLGSVSIARQLTAEGIPSRGRGWLPAKVLTILANEAYVGRVHWREETFDGRHPPLIDRDAFRTGAPEDLTRRATDALRELIASGALSPGEQLRQADVAARIGVSRSPLREALATLEQEGLLQHEPHRGYFVMRLRRDELTQVYRMRELLERELLLAIGAPSEATLRTLRARNAEMAEAMEQGSVAEMLRSNRAFHFTLFDLSPLALVRRETQRLWRLSEPYQAAYLWHPATRERVVAEHVAIVDALAAGDRDTLVTLLDAHRDAARTDVLALLPAA